LIGRGFFGKVLGKKKEEFVLAKVSSFRGYKGRSLVGLKKRGLLKEI